MTSNPGPIFADEQGTSALDVRLCYALGDVTPHWDGKLIMVLVLILTYGNHFGRETMLTGRKRFEFLSLLRPAWCRSLVQINCELSAFAKVPTSSLG